MVTPQVTIKLLDFGIAKNLNDNLVDYTITSMAQQMGTPMYMSPEQVRNTTEITKQTDIYSLGVVLWQMVMNKKPYDSEAYSLPEIQVSILNESLPLTDSIWDSKIQQATDKEPLKRGLENISEQEFELVSTNENNIENPISNSWNYKLDPKAFGVLILIFIIIWITFIFIQKKNNQSVETAEDTNSEVVVPSINSQKQSEINETGTIKPNEVSKEISKTKEVPKKVIEKPIDAKDILDRALKNSPKDVNLLYLRGIL
jgi:serine/threonine protein kinase